MPEHLTVAEQETARRQATRALRKRLELARPDPRDYADASAPVASRAVAAVLHWARFSVVLIALAAGIASAIRNVVAVYRNYTAAGTTEAVAMLAAGMFVLAVEVAIFVIALARAGVNMRKRAERAPRHVASLSTFWRGALVRLGYAEPRRHDELPERDGLGVVLLLAFAFAVTANIAIALTPALAATAEPLQVFVAGMTQSPAAQQLSFVLDLALALLPPGLAVIGGELTARFAAEYAAAGEQARALYDVAVREWRAAWTDPLATEGGGAYLEALLVEKVRLKAARQGQAAPVQRGGDGYRRVEAGERPFR